MRKQPRGNIITDAILEGTVTVTQGSATATLGAALTQNVTGWRLNVNRLRTVPLVQAYTVGSTTLTLDSVWPEETQTAGAYQLFNLEYDLPTDFLRFTGAPYLHSNYMEPIPVGVREGHDLIYPLSAWTKQIPTAAAMIQPRRIQMNSADIRGYRLEFDYVYELPPLQAGGQVPPAMPKMVRSVLAIGAAMLMCFDKSDSKAQNLASEYREMLAQMVQEFRHNISGGSMTFGVYKTRARSARRLRGPQPKGETFLV
jgi:hypothetical protein